MSKQIQIQGKLPLPAAEVWKKVITTEFILNMSSPFLEYRMTRPVPVPAEFKDGDYVMIAIGGGLLPVDRQKVRSKLSVEAIGGRYVIHNVSDGWPYSWDHQIVLQDQGDGTCIYTDGIDISGGVTAGFFRQVTRAIFAQRRKNWAASFGKQ